MLEMLIIKFGKNIPLFLLISVLIVLVEFAPLKNFNILPLSIIKTGTPSNLVPNPATKVGQLQDTAYTYTLEQIV